MLDYSRPVDLPLATGINTRDDEKTLPPVRLLDLQNAVLSKGGALCKRNGYAALGTGVLASSDVSSARALATRDDELLLADGTSLLSYSPAVDSWANRGDLQSFGVLLDTVADSPDAQVSPDCATADGMTVFAWEQGAGVYYAIIDTETRSLLLRPTLLASNGDCPRCVAVADAVLIIYHDKSSADIRVKRLVAADLTNSINSALIAFGYGDAHASSGLDAVSVGDHAFWVYRTASSGARAGIIVATGELGSPGNSHRLPALFDDGNVIAVYGISADLDIGMGAVVYKTAAGLYLKILDVDYVTAGTAVGSSAAGHLVTSATVSAATCLVYTSNQTHVWWQRDHASPFYNRTDYGLSASGGLVTSTISRHASLGSHGFYLDGVARVHLHHTSTLQGTYFLVGTDGLPVGRVLAGTAYGRATAHLPRVSGEYEWAATFKHRLDAADGSVYAQPGISHVRYDVDSIHAWSRVDMRGTLYLGGGLVWQYDGESPLEAGFLLFPENFTAVPSNGSGSLSSSGSYFYTVYWEWFNSQGDREQSTTGQVLEVPMGALDDEVTLTIPTLSMTHRQGDRRDVVLAIYRSQLDGTTRHRVTSLNPDDAGLAANKYLENNPAADIVTFVDRMSDETLATKELDYQNGAGGAIELENVAPPALRGLAEAQNRLWGVSCENRRRVYHSKLPKDETAVEWSDSLYVEMPEDIVAVGEIAGQPVFFAEDAIYAIPQGEGPDNLGFGTYGRVEQVPSDVGLATPRTLVRSPLGLLFLSRKGFWLLGNTLSLSFVGSDVQGYVAQTYVGAESLLGVSEVRFLTSEGRTLVYNYERDLWSTFTRHEGVASVVWQGTYVYAQSTGQVCKETPSTYLDAGNTIAVSCTTAWFKPGESIQGFGAIKKVYVLGRYISTHRLRLEVGYDYEPFFRQTYTIDPADFIETATWGGAELWGSDPVWGGNGNTKVYQARRGLVRRKCSAIRFRITEIPGDDGGEGLELNLLTLVVGRKVGANRLPQNRTV